MTPHDHPPGGFEGEGGPAAAPDLAATLSGIASSAAGAAPPAGAAAARRTAGRRRVARVAGVSVAVAGLAVAMPLGLALGDAQLLDRSDVADVPTTTPTQRSTAEESPPEPTSPPSREGTADPRPAEPSPTPDAEDGSPDVGPLPDRASEPPPPEPPAGPGPPPREPAFLADTGPDTGAGVPGTAVLVDVRTGLNDGFDRVVFEFDGPGIPQWDVWYVAPGAAQAADPDASAQAPTLAVRLAGVTDPGVEPEGGWPGGEAPVPYPVPTTVPGAATLVVDDVAVERLAQGEQEAYVSLVTEQPFRVFSLDSPSRVVVDVLHPVG